jgi:2-C-methyl-D-erythritol 2,4-cyclodiphosphate synthase
MRVGLGFDIHRLTEGRPLVLAGVRIEWPRGLSGHSDGDCVLHALVDGLLGAIGAGDIGDHFPDTDPHWKDADSSRFLLHALALVHREGLLPRQVDVTIFAEEPRLGPKKQDMRERVAELLGLEADAVNVKAKTMEGLGPVGAGDAVAAQALVVVESAWPEGGPEPPRGMGNPEVWMA